MIKSVLRKMNAYNIISYLRRGYFIFPSGMFEKRIGELLIAKKNSSSSREKDTCDKCKRLIDYTFGHGKFPIGDIKGFEHINFDNEECLSKLDEQLIKTLAEKSNCGREDCTEEKCKKLIDQIFGLDQTDIENGMEICEKRTEKGPLLDSNIIYHQDCNDTKENTLKVVTFRPTWPPKNGSKSGHGYRGFNYPGNNKKDKKDKRNHIQHVIVTTATTSKAGIPSISIDYRVMLEPYIDIYDDKDEDFTTAVLKKNVSVEKHKQITVSKMTNNNFEHKVNEPENMRVDLTLYSDAKHKQEQKEKAEVCAKETEKPERPGIPVSSLRQNSVINYTNQRLNIGTQQIDPFQVKNETQYAKGSPGPGPGQEKLKSNKFEVWKNVQDIMNCHHKQNAMRLAQFQEQIKQEKTESAIILNNLKEEPIGQDSLREKLIKLGKLETVTKDEPLEEEFKGKENTKSEVKEDFSTKKLMKPGKPETFMKPDPLKEESKKEKTKSAMRPDSFRAEPLKHGKPETVMRSDSFEEPIKKKKTECQKDDNWKDFEKIAVPVALHESAMPNLSNYGVKLEVPKVDTMDPLESALKREKKNESQTQMIKSVNKENLKRETNEITSNKSLEPILDPRDEKLEALLTATAEKNIFEKDAPKVETNEPRSDGNMDAAEPESSSENVTVFAAHPVLPGFDNPNQLMNGSVGVSLSKNKAAGEKQATSDKELQNEKISSETQPSPLSKPEEPVLRTEEIHPLCKTEHVLEKELVSDSIALPTNTKILPTNTQDLYPNIFSTESKTVNLMNDNKEHVNHAVIVTETETQAKADKNKRGNSTLNVDDTSTINDIDEKNSNKNVEQESFTPEYKPEYKRDTYTSFIKHTYDVPAPHRTCYINYIPQCCHYVQNPNMYQQCYQRYFLGLAEQYRHIKQLKCHEKVSPNETGEVLDTKSTEKLHANPSEEFDTKPVQVFEAKPKQVLNAETAVGVDAKSMIDTQADINQVQSNPITDTQAISDTRSNVRYTQPGNLGRGSRSRAESALKRRLPVETSAQRQLRNRRRTKHDHFSFSGPIPLAKNSVQNELPLSILLERARERNRMENYQLYESLKEQEKMYQQLKQKEKNTSKKSGRDKSPPSCSPPSPTCSPPEPPRSSPPMSFPPVGGSPKFCPPKKDGSKFFDAFTTLSVYDNDNPDERSAKAGKRREFEKRLLDRKGLNHWIFVQSRPAPLCDAENILEYSKDTSKDFIFI